VSAGSKLLLALPMVALVALAAALGQRARDRGAPNGAGEAAPLDPLAAAWRRVAERPERAERWLTLAEAQTELDQVESAERSLWTAIELGDPSGRAHARLGFLLYAQHRDDEALPLLAHAQREGVELPLLGHTLERLRARVGGRANPEASDPAHPEGPRPRAPGGDAATEPSDVGAFGREAERLRPAVEGASEAPDAGVATGTPPDAGPPRGPVPEDPAEPCTLALERLGPTGAWAVDLEVEGELARLIVDTGASLTVITRTLVEDLGIPPDDAHAIRALTANGPVVMPTAVLDRVAVGGRELRSLRVAICDDCVQDVADGLLGLDLQTSLQLRVDAASGELAFGDCDR